MTDGHTWAQGVHDGCPRCVAIGKAKGNPAHETEPMEERILRGVAVMIAKAWPSPCRYTPTYPTYPMTYSDGTLVFKEPTEAERVDALVKAAMEVSGG